MTKYDYVTIDGEKVEENVARQFEKLAAAFKKQFGLELYVNSGTRSTELQEKLWDKYRKGQGPQAARPGTSLHEEGNPKGPRAIDIKDSGKNRGVQWVGSVRANWIKKNAPKYGFDPAGFNFKNPEAWHLEYTGKIGEAAKKPSTPASKPKPEHKPPMLISSNKFGLSDVRGLQKIANLYGAKTEIDNDWGDKSERGFDAFLKAKYGNSGDAGLARWLRARWDYKGDDTYGPDMKAALVRANAANLKEL